MSRVRTLPPGINASGIHRGAEPVSQCRGSGRKPCGDAAGLRLKRASGPLQRESAFQAEPERSGNRTRDRMITSHLLYPTELSFVVQKNGIEPLPSGLPDALHELHPASPATAEHETAKRPAPVGITTSPNPWPKRRSGSINETSFSCKSAGKIFSGSRRRCVFTITATAAS